MAIILNAKKREDLTRAATNELRREGSIPSVVYGKEKEAVTVSVDEIELLKTVRDEGQNAIISLDVEGGNKVDVMLYDYQTHPVKGNVTHADFYVVDMSEALDVAVAIRIDGEAAGSREGGILQQPLFELQISAKPADIPEEIVIDVTELEIGDSIFVADLPVSDKYEFLDDADTAVVSVLPPEEEVEDEPAGDVSVEPELVGAEDEDEANAQ